MKVTRFDPTDSLIIVTAWIHGPRGVKPVALAFDTAATQTHIVPDVLDDVGYGPQHGDRITSITSAIGDEPGYMMPVSKFSALGFTMTDFRIHVHDLPDTLGIQGLLGLSFLRQFDLRHPFTRGANTRAPHRAVTGARLRTVGVARGARLRAGASRPTRTSRSRCATHPRAAPRPDARYDRVAVTRNTG